MIDVVTSEIINRLLQDQPTQSLVQGRVYKGHILSIPNPTYPCLTLQRVMGGADSDAPASSWPMYVSAYSSNSYDQAWELWTAAKGVLDWSNGQSSGISWACSPLIAPADNYDDDAGPVYYVIGAFNVRQTGQ